MKKRHTITIVLSLFLILLSGACSDTDTGQKTENPGSGTLAAHQTVTRMDTLKVNDNIVYHVTLDTIIGNLKISVSNQNMDGEYVHQDFYLNDSMLVMNHYPEMKSTIEITKDSKVIFKKSYLKKDFPKGNFYEFRQNATIRDFRFETMDETNNLYFIATLSIPNTDFSNDLELTVPEKGKPVFEWIDYESED